MKRFPGAWSLGSTVAVCGAVLAACGGAAGSSATPTSATAPYTAFGSPLAVTIAGYSGDAMEPFISKDGRFLFFNNRNDPSVDTNLFYAARVDDQDFTFLGAVTGANSPSLDAVASLDTLGNFYFVSNRSDTTTLSTIYSGTWNGSGVGAVAPVPGVSLLQAGAVNFDAEISADGQTLWFVDGKYSASGALLASSIAIADRQGTGFVRQADSATLLAAVNVGGSTTHTASRATGSSSSSRGSTRPPALCRRSTAARARTPAPPSPRPRWWPARRASAKRRHSPPTGIFSISTPW